jgi:hypothetical protein
MGKHFLVICAESVPHLWQKTLGSGEEVGFE